MTFEDLCRELAAERVRPAYLLAGSEPLLQEDALRALVEAVLPASERDFNLDRLEGDSATPGALLDAARMLPVLAPRRLVVLREPEARRAGAKAMGAALVEAVGALEEGGSTVLVVRASRIDRRAAWVKAFRDPAAVVDCEAPSRKPALVAFVRAEAGRQGLALEPGVAELLVERVGPHLLALRQELAKASLFAAEGSRISAAHASELTSDLAEEPIWDLTDAIGEGRTAEALVVLDKLVGTGAPPPVLLGALASHFRRLARVRHGVGVPGPPFVRQKLERQARRYSVRRVSDCLRAIHETDEALKGQGVLPPARALERLVLALVS